MDKAAPVHARLADRVGGLPYAHRLTRDEFLAAQALLAEMKPGTTYGNVAGFIRGSGAWTGWSFIEIGHPEKVDRRIVVGLPCAERAWTDAFYFLINTQPSGMCDETK